MLKPGLLVISCALMLSSVPLAKARALFLPSLHPQQDVQDKQQREVDDSRARSSEIVIEFEGNKVFSTPEILGEVTPCLTQYPQSKCGYDSSVLAHCVQRYLRSQGYLRAKVGEPKKQETEQGLKITVPLEEGALYRLGEIQIEGQRLFPREQIKELLNLRTGDVADGEIINEWLNKQVKNVYAGSGYIQYDYDVEPDFEPVPAGASEGVVNLKITIYGGRLFINRRIEFLGNAHTRDQVLRRALLIREGAPYSQRQLDESIKRLNELGLFEVIDRDRDVDFRSDNESPWLDITIRVKEKDK